jgi:hypothetical protein
VAFEQGQTRLRSSPQARLAAQTANGLAQHRTLAREGWPDFVFAFHDGEELGPRMLARIAKHTGLTPEDL